MTQQVTRGIKVSVTTSYENSFLKLNELKYVFSYLITIENQRKETVQLISRFWRIKDALNYPEMVMGEGVVGEKPVLMPGESYSYSSGCHLYSPFGSMIGHFNMVDLKSGEPFRVQIPLFKLKAEFAMN